MNGFDLKQLAYVVDGSLLGANAQFSAVSTDTRGLPQGALFVALTGPNFDGNEFVEAARDAGAAAALVSRAADVDLPQVLVPDTLAALARFAQYWRDQFDGPVVGITGSNGKTTVKQLTASILAQRGPVLATQGNLNNHIGVPLTLLQLRDEHLGAVIEMGANHGGEIAALADLARPTVGVVTNAGPSHLEGFGSLEGVAAAKGEMFEHLMDGGLAVINADDRFAEFWRGLANGRRVTEFSLDGEAPFMVAPGSVDLAPDGSRFKLVSPTGEAEIELAFPGRHNVRNALAAAAAAWGAGAHLEDIVAGLATAEPAQGRLARRVGIRDSLLVDDTYNANPASLQAAAEWAVLGEAPVWVVLGDMLELGGQAEALHAQAGEQLSGLGVVRLLGFGPLSAHAVRAFGADAQHFDTLDALIDELRRTLTPGATVIVKGSRGMRMERVVAALAAAEEGDH